MERTEGQRPGADDRCKNRRQGDVTPTLTDPARGKAGCNKNFMQIPKGCTTRPTGPRAALTFTVEHLPTQRVRVVFKPEHLVQSHSI